MGQQGQSMILYALIHSYCDYECASDTTLCVFNKKEDAERAAKADMQYLFEKFSESCLPRPQPLDIFNETPLDIFNETTYKEYWDRMKEWEAQRNRVAKNILKKKGYPEELCGLIQQEWSNNNDLYVQEIVCY